MMKEKKIIVVIDTNNNRKNVIRTINCIQRQTTYEEIFPIIIYDVSRDEEEGAGIETNVVEEVDEEVNNILRKITVVNDIRELGKIIKESKIEKLLFINTQITLAPNAIATLISENTDDQLALKHLIADVNGEYKTNDRELFSPYCKMYNTNELLAVIDEESKVDKCMQLKYILLGKTTRIVDAYAYQRGDTGIGIDFDTDYEFIKLLIDNEKFCGIDIVTDIVEKTLCKAFEESVEAENEQAFCVLQKSFETLTFNEDVLAMECKKYSIPSELFKIIGKCNSVQFKKMYEKFRNLQAKHEQSMVSDTKTTSVELARIENVVNDLRLRVGSLEQEQNGYEVAKHVVHMYQDGRLGMGTIIKSVFAWARYKVLGKR